MHRSSGILLHPTSLPGALKIGDIAAAYPFIDWLTKTQQAVWQILPLNPPGAGISPYSCLSSHAGNPLLISLQLLADETGLLTQDELDEISQWAHAQGNLRSEKDIQRLSLAKEKLLAVAADRFWSGKTKDRADFRRWHDANKDWLTPDAHFYAISQEQQTTDWSVWPKQLSLAKASAVAERVKQLDYLVKRWQFIQWVFDEQWARLKRYANSRGIEIIGDLPIYCAHHSVDVWANQALFELASDGHPMAVAGVPPDYFSESGQRWGSPLYRWQRHEKTGFAWWRARMASALKRCDRLRIDHFRAFASYWRIPSESPDARTGRWVEGPGIAFFNAMRQSFSPLPIIIEDLGLLTDDVIDLRDRLGLPGMSILQFAFGSDLNNVYLPHRLCRNTVVYTGTHDNDTSQGWWESAGAEEKKHFRQYFATRGTHIHRIMVRAAFASVADLAVVPMQDVIGAGSEARMNLPGEAHGQWAWGFDWSEVSDEDTRFIARLTRLYSRNADRAVMQTVSLGG